ncbi:uncharacterized protein B0H18DRAFT_1052171, partial [Fomitopsis serialis]|uniref:uncharacterized protein n=1 Tax=Fomitopsis serialis TaxID=139415 RepID=UPI002007EBDD
MLATGSGKNWSCYDVCAKLVQLTINPHFCKFYGRVGVYPEGTRPRHRPVTAGTGSAWVRTGCTDHGLSRTGWASGRRDRTGGESRRAGVSGQAARADRQARSCVWAAKKASASGTGGWSSGRARQQATRSKQDGRRAGQWALLSSPQRVRTRPSSPPPRWAAIRHLSAGRTAAQGGSRPRASPTERVYTRAESINVAAAGTYGSPPSRRRAGNIARLLLRGVAEFLVAS